MPDVVTVLKQECLGSLVEQQMPLSFLYLGNYFVVYILEAQLSTLELFIWSIGAYYSCYCCKHKLGDHLSHLTKFVGLLFFFFVLIIVTWSKKCF